MVEPLAEQQPFNEGEYIEMSNHLKKVYDEMELKNQKLNFDKMELQKILMSAYGFTRVIDNLVGNLMDIPGDVVLLIEHLRGFLSDALDQYIFNIQQLTFD